MQVDETKCRFTSIIFSVIVLPILPLRLGFTLLKLFYFVFYLFSHGFDLFLHSFNFQFLKSLISVPRINKDFAHSIIIIQGKLK